MQISDLLNLGEDGLIEIMESLDDDALEEFKAALMSAKAERQMRVEALGSTLAQRRAEAISARANSGIEDEWLEDEEFYEGIDDANRGEMSAWSSKPPGREAIDTDDTSSTIFLNITAPYCDAAGASLADMLLPTDDSAWHITNTPVPELLPFVKGDLSEQVRQGIESEAQGQPDPEAYAQQMAQQIATEAQAILTKAKDKAEAAQKRIEDWHVESQYHAEVRRVVEDCAKIGSGVLKGPVPVRRKQVAYQDGALVIQEEIKPASKRIDYWNLFPDGGCGDNLHNGSYIFERDDITSKQLRDLIGVPGYLEEQIRAALDEGPTQAEKEFRDIDDMKRRDTANLYEIWYFHGEIPKEDMEAAGCECERDAMPAQITMVNNRVIKATLNPLDTGDFPYDIMVWKKRKGVPWGTGVARAIRTPQRMINGAGRNLMDNAGLAGGPMWYFKQGVLTPIDGVAELAPRKGWIASEDAELDHLQNAFGYFKLDMMVNELQSIIQLGLKMAEDVTGLPMIMQGQMGQQSIDTLGQTQILNNNANIVRRRIARLFDDLVTEPHVRRYYAYLLQYGEDNEKGEFVIDARGSSNLVERTIQKEKTLELMNMAQNPVFGLDPKKVAREYLRSEKFDPKNFEYDDEEWKEIVANLSQPQQQDPRLAIAEMNAQLRLQAEQMKLEAGMAKQDKDLQHRERMKSADIQSDQQVAQMRAEIEQAVAVFEGDLKKQLAEMKYQGDKDIQFDKLKTSLNETVMRLTTQKELSALSAPARHMPAPPTEPAGRAPAGQSYQR
jgi:hypothetical protein